LYTIGEIKIGRLSKFRINKYFLKEASFGASLNFNFADFSAKYKWSSASFYETGIDEFGILTDYRL
jgi:hypothetical protein